VPSLLKWLSWNLGCEECRFDPTIFTQFSLHEMMVVAAFIYVFCGLSPCQAAKVANSQIKTIQADKRSRNSLGFSVAQRMVFNKKFKHVHVFYFD